ncbi:MAG: tRNA pseudouridine(65) synthase TruC [Sulfurimonas sp.]|nr:tRNA pseudouridine(65) synthase TruC [Sulfurimonas sp.]MDD3059618.1 tRNA pseudouridine(65) synthase TruC [Sulfurimonas sp.]MDD5202694.1 tRNA pseudouridine(65) synthase TruC [Sulfurimonas sp.]
MWNNYKLEILYQDVYLVAINKPSGLLVHKSMIDKDEIYFAMAMLRDQIGQWVYPVHRLDKPTSGVLLFALDSETARLMSQQFEMHSIEKSYVAVVRGYTQEQGEIDYALSVKLDKMTDKNASKDKEAETAITRYKTLAKVELNLPLGRYEKTRYSLVQLWPKTGRKHQLRRHMKHISHHILGDTNYGRGEHNKLIRENFDCHRLLLHSNSLRIKHPYTHEIMTFRAAFDKTFEHIFTAFGWNM